MAPPAPEVLHSGGGHGAVPPYGAPPAPSGRGKGRRGLIAGGALVGVGAVAVGGWFAYSAYFATGPQPAEALPASTIGYLSIDLDPSGKQKLEILDTLNKFPGFRDNVDIGGDDDVIEKFFDLAQDESGACPDLDYSDDIEPWLGSRFAIAAVDLGKDTPTPVAVIQVKDADKAEAGFQTLVDCGSATSGDDDFASSDEGGDVIEDEPEDFGGWEIRGDWAVLAESDEIATEVADATEDASLADDDDFEKWTDAAGDPGVLTAYAAPEAADFLIESATGLGSGDAVSCTDELEPSADPSALPYEEPYDDPFDDCAYYEDQQEQQDEEAEQLKNLFEDFEGAALTVRFDDGGLEVESAASVDYLGMTTLFSTDRGDDVVATLPEDTAVAFGVGFEEGWFTELTDYIDELAGGMLGIDDALAELEAETGLSLPEDVETLFGDSVAVAFGSDFDADGLDSDDPESIPLGVKIHGDTDAITAIIDKLLASADLDDELKDEFNYETGDGYVVAGFSSEFTEGLLADGDLGDSDLYQDLVPDSGDANAVFYVNFDANDWLVEALQALDAPDEVIENVEPLEGIGATGWTDDDVSHSLLRITFE